MIAVERKSLRSRLSIPLDTVQKRKRFLFALILVVIYATGLILGPTVSWALMQFLAVCTAMALAVLILAGLLMLADRWVNKV